MKFFSKLSIKRKQALIIVGTTGVALFLACAAFALYELVVFRQTLVGELSTLAEAVGNNCAAALDFSDPRGAEETLSALGAERTVIGAAVYDKSGQVFAIYDRPGDGIEFHPPPRGRDGYQFKHKVLTIFRPVARKGEALGTVYVESDLGPLYSRLERYGAIVLSVFVAATLIALGLSAWLQRVISGPILHLARTARTVAQDKNYSVRATKETEDELGALVEGFNEMLSQIQRRDAELQRSKNELEQRVVERTAELAGSNAALQRENLERQQGEAKLRRTEELYRRAISGAGAVPYCYDYNTRTYSFIGEGVEKLLGYTPAQMSRQLWERIIEENVMRADTAGLSKAEAARRVTSGEIKNWSCDMRVITRQGQSRWISDDSVQNLDEAGRPCGSMGILQDITERKKVEESLRLLSSAIEHSADNVLITDAKGVIEYANPALLQLTGYSKEEIIGQTPRVLKSGTHAASFYAELWATILAGKTFRGEFNNKRKSGEIYTEEKTITPVYDAQNRITHFIASGRDITQRKQTEAALEAAHQQLIETSRKAGMAEVASNVLHNVGNVLNSVNVSTSMLTDKVATSKSAILSKVTTLLDEHAHDLAGFLTNDAKGRQIPGFLSTLNQHLATERRMLLTELSLLGKNVEHIKDIIAMQQNYAKVSGVVEPISLGELMEDALRMNQAAFARHDIEVVRQFEEVPAINTEKHKVLQIIVNLIRNAKYAVDEGARQPRTVYLGIARNGGDFVRITVRDNGVGIPAENLQRIFNHGFTTRKDGHGFGLHSGALAARELGGKLQVHSDGPGKGATFTLELPMNRKT
jgi:PAS domain S-box-containing protein